MQPDSEGFVFPVKNFESCTNCGLCEKVCPFNSHHEDNNYKTMPYATYAKKREDRIGSSSGGAFFIIAKRIIAQGGVVYGVAFNPNLEPTHIRVEDLKGLDLLRGSKYVQSDLKNTFREIREDLRKGKLVYFTGVGCQVAGLKRFLIREYDNLITSDLVCHGVPNQKLFKSHIKYLEDKYKGKVIDYRFRDNLNWRVREIITIKDKDNKKRVIEQSSYKFSPFLFSFEHSMTLRLSCYECPFAKLPRQGDITLADYWGVTKFFPEIDTSGGVSLILINSSKGQSYVETLKSHLTLYQSNIQDATAENPNIVTTTLKPAVRDTIFDQISKYGYPKVAKTIFRPRYYRLLYFSSLIKNLIGEKNTKYIKLFIQHLLN